MAEETVLDDLDVTSTVPPGLQSPAAWVFPVSMAPSLPYIGQPGSDNVVIYDSDSGHFADAGENVIAGNIGLYYNFPPYTRHAADTGHLPDHTGLAQNASLLYGSGAVRSLPMQGWTAGLANRHYVPCNIVCLGDSVTEGQGATSFDRRWLARLRDVLRQRYPTVGPGTGGGRGFIASQSTGESSFTWPPTYAGGMPVIVGGGPKGSDFFGSGAVQFNATGQTVSFALTGDNADIMWTTVPFGGTFSYKVDSGSVINVSTNGSPLADGTLTRVALGSAGAHTLLLSWVSGNANVDGVIEYNGDAAAGIRVHDCGHYGWSGVNWFFNALNAGQGFHTAQAIAALNPCLVIIMVGYNDQFSNFSSSGFISTLQSIISALRAAMTNPLPSFLLCMLPPRVNQSTFTFPWAQYINSAYVVAATDNAGIAGSSMVSVCDMTLGPRMLAADVDSGNILGLWHTSDLVHPSDKGHSLIGDFLADTLSVL